MPNAFVPAPITTEPNTTHYEWAGRTLQALLNANQPVSETWPFFSGPQKPARIAGADGSLTMETLVTRHPEVLGPNGCDPENQRQKYFFVKFLDPSDFPAFAYVGFAPEAVAALRKPGDEFKAYVAELLWRDRQALETLLPLVHPTLSQRSDFEAFKAAYKQWAIAQAAANWEGQARMDLARFVDAARVSEAAASLESQRQVRRLIVSLMHRIDFKPDQAILIETPTLHAIAGLSLQLHPKAPGNFFPKDELWIYEEVRLPDGRMSWVLVEPQRTFDKTESGADFFTPFAWQGKERAGRIGFRKTISRTYLEDFVRLMDATPHPQAHYVRRPQRMMIAGGTTEGGAEWFRVVEETAWPYFLVRQLRFHSAGAATMPCPHHSFIELHATRGAVTVELQGASGPAASCMVTPARAVFLPANLPYHTLTFRASEPARLHFFTRPL
ncbi:MAG: hypothetical protein COV75_04355 [Candidatus Omnitrophica bacterium CG11_big_fil_rev_8_21_14_0_20_63_9]|nr:MAG: hypothetical protein COV75_04355 [Candidatus Omnitrophica bacterium CG11_big_fil_rev_8_21_14_0_20_63_9]